MVDASLTEVQLLGAAGDITFGRGEDYVRYVRGLRVVGSSAQATIQAKNVYLVDLEWSTDELGGSCSCPHFADGSFCKHLVAVGLCVVDGTPNNAQPAEDGRVLSLIDDYLDGLDATALRALVTELLARDESAVRLLEVRASVSSGEQSAVSDDLVAAVNEALSTRGFVDYRRSFEVARDAQEILDELESHLEAGAADAVRPALLRALTRLRKVTEHADDSSGSLGQACQRAADLYARSCRDGQPDPGKLARWLVKFRDESPGWPVTTLPDFVEAFDDKALNVYRKAVAKLEEKYADLDEWKNFELNRMLLELADHDGDVDRAVQLLQRGRSPQYGAIVERLRKADRFDEALACMDRAVADGRVSSRGRGNEYFLDVSDVAETYLSTGRTEAALEVLRGEFIRSPSAATYKHLIGFAGRIDRGDQERVWALDEARAKAQDRFGNGGVLVEIALRDDDLDAAWHAAGEYGAGHMWQPLAQASADSRPRDAAALYRPQVDELLRHANTKVYPKIAELLVTMRDLYRKAGAEAEFTAYVAELRAAYHRRTSLMAALDRKRL